MHARRKKSHAWEAAWNLAQHRLQLLPRFVLLGEDGVPVEAGVGLLAGFKFVESGPGLTWKISFLTGIRNVVHEGDARTGGRGALLMAGVPRPPTESGFSIGQESTYRA